MNTIQLNMNKLYLQNLNSYAIKNKISIDTNVDLQLDQTSEENILKNEDTDVVYSDEYIYKKTWNKLNKIHKIIKLKEFVNNLQINDMDMKKKLKTNLVDMCKDKKLSKKTDVNYDSVNGTILSIPILQYNNNKYTISVKV
jgi:hypothetical protein